MIDASLAGLRCRAIHEIRTCQGLIRRFSEGVIQYDMENFGRHLIRVQWDSGVVDYAYPLEIEVAAQREAVAAG